MIDSPWRVTRFRDCLKSPFLLQYRLAGCGVVTPPHRIRPVYASSSFLASLGHPEISRRKRLFDGLLEACPNPFCCHRKAMLVALSAIGFRNAQHFSLAKDAPATSFESLMKAVTLSPL